MGAKEALRHPSSAVDDVVMDMDRLLVSLDLGWEEWREEAAEERRVEWKLSREEEYVEEADKPLECASDDRRAVEALIDMYERQDSTADSSSLLRSSDLISSLLFVDPTLERLDEKGAE